MPNTTLTAYDIGLAKYQKLTSSAPLVELVTNYRAMRKLLNAVGFSSEKFCEKQASITFNANTILLDDILCYFEWAPKSFTKKHRAFHWAEEAVASMKWSNAHGQNTGRGVHHTDILQANIVLALENKWKSIDILFRPFSFVELGTAPSKESRHLEEQQAATIRQSDLFSDRHKISRFLVPR